MIPQTVLRTGSVIFCRTEGGCRGKLGRGQYWRGVEGRCRGWVWDMEMSIRTERHVQSIGDNVFIWMKPSAPLSYDMDM